MKLSRNRSIRIFYGANEELQIEDEPRNSDANECLQRGNRDGDKKMKKGNEGIEFRFFGWGDFGLRVG
jgi:hypothetical protein